MADSTVFIWVVHPLVISVLSKASSIATIFNLKIVVFLFTIFISYLMWEVARRIPVIKRLTV